MSTRDRALPAWLQGAGVRRVARPPVLDAEPAILQARTRDEIVACLERVIDDAIAARFASLHIEELVEGGRIRVRSDGRLWTAWTCRGPVAGALLTWIGWLAGIGACKPSRPVDTVIEIPGGGRLLRLPVTLICCERGWRASIQLPVEPALEVPPEFRDEVLGVKGLVIVASDGDLMPELARCTAPRRAVLVRNGGGAPLDGVVQVRLDPRRGVTLAHVLDGIRTSPDDALIVDGVEPGHPGLELLRRAASVCTVVARIRPEELRRACGILTMLSRGRPAVPFRVLQALIASRPCVHCARSGLRDDRERSWAEALWPGADLPAEVVVSASGCAACGGSGAGAMTVLSRPVAAGAADSPVVPLEEGLRRALTGARVSLAEVARLGLLGGPPGISGAQ